MASPAVTARLRFLNASAHLLATTSAPTSAHLMSQCNNLRLDNGIEISEDQRRHVCSACGNIMLVGWTSSLKLKGSKGPKAKKPDKPKTGPKTSKPFAKEWIYTCDSCASETRLHIGDNATSKPRVQKLRAAVAGVGAPTSASIQPETPSSNSTSKKRAKARKQGGLQALLAKSKEPRNNIGFGLDLLDLMKTA